MTKSQGDRAIKSPPDDQVQKTIAILKVELPTLFEQDISYDIYTPDIFFQDPVNTFRYKFNYRIIFWTLRFHGRLFFTDLHFDVHEVRQAASDLIQVDWTVRGTLRLPWRSQIFSTASLATGLEKTG